MSREVCQNHKKKKVYKDTGTEGDDKRQRQKNQQTAHDWGIWQKQNGTKLKGWEDSKGRKGREWLMKTLSYRPLEEDRTPLFITVAHALTRLCQCRTPENTLDTLWSHTHLGNHSWVCQKTSVPIRFYSLTDPRLTPGHIALKLSKLCDYDLNKQRKEHKCCAWKLVEVCLC